jgi:hypothetical protein
MESDSKNICRVLKCPQGVRNSGFRGNSLHNCVTNAVLLLRQQRRKNTPCTLGRTTVVIFCSLDVGRQSGDREACGGRTLLKSVSM